MLHVFFIILIEKILDFDSVTINPYIGIPIIIATTYLLSEVASFILNRIPIIKKYIV